MKPILFSWGTFHLYTFGLMVATGVLVAIFLMLRAAHQQGFPRREDLWDLVFTCIVAGFLGGRLFYIIQYREWYWNEPLKIFAVWEGGLIFYGGLFGALLAVIVLCRRRGLPVMKIFDFLVVYAPLTHFFGRLGCFLNGCCHGKVCHLPWAVQFPDAGFAVHPTQLYEALFLLVLFILLRIAYGKRQFDGQMLMTYLCLYGWGRFSLEYFREGNPMLGLWTWNQWLSGALTVGALIIYFYFWKKKASRGAV